MGLNDGVCITLSDQVAVPVTFLVFAMGFEDGVWGLNDGVCITLSGQVALPVTFLVFAIGFENGVRGLTTGPQCRSDAIDGTARN